MSKYVELLKTAQPEHLYVFDLDETAIGGGTVTDIGYNPVNATILASGGAAVEVYPSLVNGLSRSNHLNVIHDYDTGDVATFSAFELPSSVASEYFGPDSMDNWVIELVGKMQEHIRARTTGSLVAVNQTGVNGLELLYDKTDVEQPTFEFRMSLDFDQQDDVEIFVTANNYVPSDIYHVALLKNENSYSLYVNGDFATSGVYDSTYTDKALTTSAVRIGGWNGEFHADATVQSFAMFARQNAEPRDIRERSDAVSFDSTYETLEILGPDFRIETELDGSKGVLEPFLTPLSTGTLIDELYENRDDELTLQGNQLGAGAVTVSKKLKFDLSGLTAGILTFLDITTVTDANSSVTVNYSFDDAAYSVWTEGTDNIPELDANWGGAV